MLHRIREVLKNHSIEKLAVLGGNGGITRRNLYRPHPGRGMHKDRRVKLQAIHGQSLRGDMYVRQDCRHGIAGTRRSRDSCQGHPEYQSGDPSQQDPKDVKYGTRIYTDEQSYSNWDCKKATSTISWTIAKQYVSGQVHTNGLENFWSLFKRNLRGTYVSVEPFHLDRYTRRAGLALQ